MQRVIIARETVQDGLFFRRDVLGDPIRWSGGGFISRCRGAAILGFGDAAEAAGAADEDCAFVVEERFACFFVDGCDSAFDDGGVAFVDYFEEFGV